jgi:Ca2+-binding RTX toxin-like protein
VTTDLIELRNLLQTAPAPRPDRALAALNAQAESRGLHYTLERPSISPGSRPLIGGDDNVFGSDGNDRLLGGNGVDHMFGYLGKDNLNGGNGNDVIDGGGGNDSLQGAAGDDVLIGGAGRDVLAGGAGNDTFVFDVLETSSNKDTIRDFVSGADHIELAISAFPALAGYGTGALSTGELAFGTAATAADQHLIYNSATGALYYDVDGAGGAAQVQIAQLAGASMLNAGDIVLI